ncbi:MAG: M14 family metallocarboxypeptidase [Verrucomicrobiales bacterium]
MDPSRLAFLVSHQAHDAGALLRRWRRAARDAGWRMRTLDRAGKWPVFAIDSPAASGEAPGGLYLSAGMHGDEPAPAWGMLEWFEGVAGRLAGHPVSIVPCFNPHGFAANQRTDHGGEDLNRQFHRADHPLVAAWRAWLGSRPFQLGVCLHEDYDARGTYCYELARRGGPSLGDRLLSACDPILPRDSRGRIEGRRAQRGLIRRTVPPRDLPGHPEAIALHLNYAEHNLTFETPSEFCLHDRVLAHRAFLHATIEEMGW